METSKGEPRPPEVGPYLLDQASPFLMDPLAGQRETLLPGPIVVLAFTDEYLRVLTQDNRVGFLPKTASLLPLKVPSQQKAEPFLPPSRDESVFRAKQARELLAGERPAQGLDDEPAPPGSGPGIWLLATISTSGLAGAAFVNYFAEDYLSTYSFALATVLMFGFWWALTAYFWSQIKDSLKEIPPWLVATVGGILALGFVEGAGSRWDAPEIGALIGAFCGFGAAVISSPKTRTGGVVNSGVLSSPLTVRDGESSETEPNHDGRRSGAKASEPVWPWQEGSHEITAVGTRVSIYALDGTESMFALRSGDIIDLFSGPDRLLTIRKKSGFLSLSVGFALENASGGPVGLLSTNNIGWTARASDGSKLGVIGPRSDLGLIAGRLALWAVISIPWFAVKIIFSFIGSMLSGTTQSDERMDLGKFVADLRRNDAWEILWLGEVAGTLYQHGERFSVKLDLHPTTRAPQFGIDLVMMKFALSAGVLLSLGDRS